MKYILIWIVFNSSNVSATGSHTFDTEKACQVAGQTLKETWVRIKFVCVGARL